MRLPLSCLSARVCVCPCETSLTRYPEKHMTDFRLAYVNNALWTVVKFSQNRLVWRSTTWSCRSTSWWSTLYYLSVDFRENRYNWRLPWKKWLIVIDFFFGPMRFLDSTFQKYSVQVSFISIILRILGVVFSLTGLFGITALFTHCVKWSSCPSDGFTQRLVQKTGSFTQTALP